MRDPSRTRAAVRLGLLAIAVAVLAWGAWWLIERALQPAEPHTAQAQAEPTVSERLADVLEPENAPTTEADPPQVKDGVSQGHAAGLHRTLDALRLKASAAFVIDQRSGEVMRG